MLWGTILNPTGYSLSPTGKWEKGMGYLFGLTALIGLRRKRRQYEFTLGVRNGKPCEPVTFFHPEGYYIRPDRHGLTDLGSIPELLEPWMARSSHEAAFLFHDSGCRERGLYFSGLYDGPYTFCPMPSRDVHDLLGLMIRAGGGWPCTALAVRRLVSRFGPRWS